MTRVTKDNQTNIDLLFSNNRAKEQMTHESKITDHMCGVTECE